MRVIDAWHDPRGDYVLVREWSGEYLYSLSKSSGLLAKRICRRSGDNLIVDPRNPLLSRLFDLPLLKGR